MSKSKQFTITVQGTTIGILPRPEGDYISLTDMVRNFDGASALIEQWLKNKDTVLFLGVWERINNAHFNSPEFEGIRYSAPFSISIFACPFKRLLNPKFSSTPLPGAPRQAKEHPVRAFSSISALPMRATQFSFFSNSAALLQLLRQHPSQISLV